MMYWCMKLKIDCLIYLTIVLYVLFVVHCIHSI